MSDSTPSPSDHRTDGRSRDSQERLALEASSDLAPGGAPLALGLHTVQTIGRFKLRRMLGEGAYGCVYLAFDTRLHREVALKVPLHIGFSPAFRDRFLREARATATVIHPNVCQVHEAETEGNVPYIVMRYVEGGSLADLLARAGGPLSPHTAAAIVRKLALGLEAVHAQGIVHRDLKPSNVLYDATTDDVLLTDFGLAKFLEHASQSSGGVKGTAAYMPPEQFGDGEQPGDVGPLSDVYSLGVILYELLTGTLPFKGNPYALMLAHLRQIPHPPSARLPGLETRLDALCLKALAKAPADRYPSARAFAEALDDYLNGTISPDQPSITDEIEQLDEAKAYERGEDYYFGRGVPQDYVKARELYKLAAAWEHADAQNDLGYMYRHGLGGDCDYAKAREWFERAASQGHVTAQSNLGYLYRHGLGVERDYAKAREWFEKAASKGNTGAQYHLGYLYRHGLGVERDYAKARELYAQAAAQGHAGAQHDLGYMYQRGRGVERDLAKARELYEQAAAQGRAGAQYALGRLYENALGVERDHARAREWYEKAASQGNKDAKKALERLKGR